MKECGWHFVVGKDKLHFIHKGNPICAHMSKRGSTTFKLREKDSPVFIANPKQKDCCRRCLKISELFLEDCPTCLANTADEPIGKEASYGH